MAVDTSAVLAEVEGAAACLTRMGRVYRCLWPPCPATRPTWTYSKRCEMYRTLLADP